jgi:ABC-type glycerol-3-phosphate transport system substrate-binding protein
MPADTDELWQWAHELTTQDATGGIERLGMALPNWLWEHLGWMVNFGGELWDAEAEEPTPDHPGVLAALTDLVEQVEYWGVEALDTWSNGIGAQSGAQDPWLAGKLTMKVDGDWAGQSALEFFPDWEFGIDYGAAAPPPAPASKSAGDSAVCFWSWPWVIPSGTTRPDWSWEVLRFFLSTEYQVKVHAKFKEILVRKSMIDDERLWWPATVVVRDLIKSGRKLTSVMPMNPVASEYLTLLDAAVDGVLHLAETPEEAMARVKEEVLAALAESAE